MAQPNKRRIRLRRIVRLKRIQIGTGDGGAYTDKYLPIMKPPKDTSFVVKDTAVVAKPMN